MTQEKKKLINLSVHESSDPSVISSNSETEASVDRNDLDDAVREDENSDLSSPGVGDIEPEEQTASRQNTIANLSAG